MTEFKEALWDFDCFISESSSANTVSFIGANEAKTIRRALLIADKLMQEPTYWMTHHGAMAILDPKLTGNRREMQEAVNAFKAMRDQMLKEIAE